MRIRLSGFHLAAPELGRLVASLLTIRTARGSLTLMLGVLRRIGSVAFLGFCKEGARVKGLGAGGNFCIKK